jgi:hypothetical protein
MTRTRIALSLTTLGLTGALGLTACGAPASSAQAAGLERAEPSASAAAGQRAPAARKLLRKNTLHGEMTVQGKDGVRTIVVQRGAVTAVDAKSVSVKSTDGYALTWALGDQLKVRQDKKKVEPDAVRVGTKVAVAGARDGEAVTARLILIG